MELFNKNIYHFTDFQSELRSWQNSLKENGVLVLEDFINPKILPAVIAEAAELSKDCYQSNESGNCYLRACDAKFACDHPENREELSTFGVVAYDQFSDTSLIKSIYKNESFRTWLASLLGLETIYEYLCPLGGLNVSALKKGDKLRWHFDLSDFVVGIHLQDADQGGTFDYVRNLRSNSEPNYEGVKRALDGLHPEMQTLNSPPGSLVLFEGRYTLHRVSQVKGEKTRLNMLLGYADRAGVQGSKFLQEIRYGRTLGY